MLSRIRKSMDEKDQGFTLIELLVVMIIIGILAAIAIPVFLNQRERAVESSMQSDARTVATEVETFFVDNQAYPATDVAATANTVTVGTEPVSVSNGNTVAVDYGTDAFCITVDRSAGAPSQDAGPVFYDSDAGGLVDACT